MFEGCTSLTTEEMNDNAKPVAREARLTGELALYGILALVALLVRLVSLGRWPLLPEEVPTALAATQALAGRQLHSYGYMPLLFDAQLPLLSLQSSPFSARLFTALAGAFMVLLPYGARAWLGRHGALAVSALLALSPTWVYAGRTADGAAVSIGFGVLGLLLLQSARDPTAARNARAGAACLGLALASGAQIFSVLMALAIVGAIQWRHSAPEDRAAWRARWTNARPVTLAVCALVAWAMAATAGLLNPGGLGAAVDVAGHWLGTLVHSDGLPAYQPLVVFAVYEPVALSLALFALYRGWREGTRLDAGLRIWLLLSVIGATLLGHRGARWMLCVSLPLTLLAGRAVELVVERSLLRLTRADGLALAAGASLTGFAFVELGGYLQTLQGTYLVLAAVGAGVLIAALVGYAAWVGKAAAARVGACLALSLALMLTARGTVALAYDRARDPWEPMLDGPTAGTLAALGPFLEHLSLTRAGDPRIVDILYEQALEPDIVWLLREYPNARETVRVGAPSRATILVSTPRGDGAEPQGYFGQSFALREWRPAQMRPLSDTIKWLLFRQPGPEAVREEFTVWVRLDPGGGNG
ncbi:MAG: hypothetical protein ACYCYF_03450, partial [Anaerolineae bacterium]